MTFLLAQLAVGRNCSIGQLLIEVALSIAAVLAIAYVIRFVRQVRSLPPGPTPLPVLGNILQLRAPRPMYEKCIAWSKQFGDPITVWVGPRPFAVANTTNSFKDISGPHRNNVAGRAQSKLGDLHIRGNTDIVFSDFSPAWDVLRRVSHVAIRKYAKTERLAKLVINHVDAELNELFGGSVRPKYNVEAQDERMRSGGSATKWNIVDFVENVINNVTAVSAFGEGFHKDDPDYKRLRWATMTFEKEGANGLPSDILWILGYVFYKRERMLTKVIDDFFAVTLKMFRQAAETYKKGTFRHFTDTLLNARDEFLDDERESAKYLTNENLGQAVFDIFGAGIGTSKTVISYAFLRLANDPELQEELRAEIVDVCGHDRMCISSDRSRLPKVDAFIQEVIRFYPPAPLALPRRAMTDVSINGRLVPKDCALLINVYAVNRDANVWGPDAGTFNPKRFLSASAEQLAKGVNSFGIGARSCPGEKMAQADILYVIVRVLQRVRLSCPNGPGTADLESIDSDILLDVRRQDLIFELL